MPLYQIVILFGTLMAISSFRRRGWNVPGLMLVIAALVEIVIRPLLDLFRIDYVLMLNCYAAILPCCAAYYLIDRKLPRAIVVATMIVIYYGSFLLVDVRVWFHTTAYLALLIIVAAVAVWYLDQLSRRLYRIEDIAWSRVVVAIGFLLFVSCSFTLFAFYMEIVASTLISIFLLLIELGNLFMFASWMIASVLEAEEMSPSRQFIRRLSATKSSTNDG